MKILLFLMCLSFAMLSQNLDGQDISRLEGEKNARRVKQFGMEDGDRNAKNQRTRADILEIEFDLPDNLKIHFHSENAAFFTTSIYGPDYLGSCIVSYTDSQFYARRELAFLIHITGNRSLFSDDFTRIEGVGDDICLMQKNRNHIYFIRDCIAIRIDVDSRFVDAEKLARFFDQKLKEENDKLNVLVE